MLLTNIGMKRQENEMSIHERQSHSSEGVLLFWKEKMHFEKRLSSCLKNVFECTALTLKITGFFFPSTCSGKFKDFNLALSRFDWHAGSTAV